MSNDGETFKHSDTVLDDTKFSTSQLELKIESGNEKMNENTLVKKNYKSASESSESPNISPYSEIDEANCDSDDSDVLQSNIRIKYSRSELLLLMNTRDSRQWPDYFDQSFQKPQGRIDLEKWVRSKQDKGQTIITSSNASHNNTSSGTPVNVQTVNSSNERPPDLEIKKTRDPRERVKQEEQDGIVLSPQRRSFGTGCHVLQQGFNSASSSASNVPSDAPPERGHGRENQPREMPNRRIGSGRIVRREEPEPLMDRRREPDREIDQRRDHKDWRSKNEHKYERERHDKRRRFFEEDDKRRDRGYHNHRRSNRDIEEDAPEWFTEGPTSQNEYIELVGFDDQEEQKPKRERERRKSKKERAGGNKGPRSTTPVIIEQDETVEESYCGTMNQEGKSEPIRELKNPIVIEPPVNDKEMNLNIDDILNDILTLATDDLVPNNTGNGSSRMKQYFQDRESPIQNSQDFVSNSHKSLNSSTQLNSFLSGFSEQSSTKVASPNASLDSSRFFSPISPANKTSNDAIADLFSQANTRKPLAGSGRLHPPSVKDLLMGGKGQSLEEIEASMRVNSAPTSSSMGAQMRHQNGSGQLNPFNDFLSQISNGVKRNLTDQTNSGNNILSKLMNDQLTMKKQQTTAHPNKVMTENEFLTRLVNNTNGCAPPMNGVQHSNLNVPPPSMGHKVSPPGSAASLSPLRATQMLKQDLLMTLLHNQQQIQQKKKIHSNYQPQVQQDIDPIKQLVGGLNNVPSKQTHNTSDNPILMTEIQNLYKRVMNGQVTDTQLISLLSSGNLNRLQRDTFTAVLKIINNHHSTVPLMPQRATLTPSPTPQMMGATPVSLSPRVASPNPEGAAMLAPHILQQTRVSPSMFGSGNMSSGAPRRQPSHQELVVHTQNILQNALLKQELVKAKEDGSPAKGAKCQSPLAFTPTSVMRKMTAEKDRLDKSENLHHIDKNRDHMSAFGTQGPMHSGNTLKVDNRGLRVTSPIPNQSMLGPNAHMVMGGQNMHNMGVNQRQHMGMPVGRPNINNIRVLQHNQTPTLNQQQQQYMRGGPFNVPQQRMNTNPNPLTHYINNNNNYKTEANLQVPHPNVFSSRNSPVNLMHLFGRDIMAQVQAGPPMPDLPGGKAMSLEEVERLHKTQAAN